MTIYKPTQNKTRIIPVIHTNICGRAINISVYKILFYKIKTEQKIVKVN